MPLPKLLVVLVSLLLFTPLIGLGQTPVKVKLCDLVRDPEKYTRQWVEVRGTVDLAFEDFSLHTGDCGPEQRGIWLAYGGDQPTPTPSTANDTVRKPGTVFKVDGISVPLERDAALRLFQDRLMARRLRTPDGSGCDQDCRLYEVTATFVGLFMGATEYPNTPFSPLLGYGHLGCCHLLAIRRVIAVDAKRTEVPAGGRFACSEATWEIDHAQETDFLKGNFCTDREECRKADREQFRLLTEHWNDRIKIDHESTHDFKTGLPVWRSADLLTTYSWKDPEDIQRNITATRTVCKPIEAPYSPHTPIRCTTLFSEFNTYSKKWDKAQKTSKDEIWMGAPEVVSRYALEEVARRSHVVLMPGLVLEECSKIDEHEGVQDTACEWSEPSGMQSFYIQLARPRSQHPLSEMEKIPWELAGWDGMACVAAAQ
jgi:hypothetical protein